MNDRARDRQGKASPRPGWPRLGRNGRAVVVLLVLAAAGSGVGTLQARSPAEAARREPAAGTPTVVTPVVRPHRVIAYYFHTTQRCASCRAIEAYSHEAIESAFADELGDGRLVWRVVNIEARGNEHFVRDYSLYTKSLVLVHEVRGKPARWKNLADVWTLLQDKRRFLRYVQDEVRGALAERS